MPKVVRKFYRDGVEYKIKFDKSWKPGANTIAYYPLKNDANDYSGNWRNGTATNISFISWYALWNWVNSRITSTLTDDWIKTISLWVKRVWRQEDWRFVASSWTSSNTGYHQSLALWTDNKWSISTHDSNEYVSDYVADNNWVYLCATFKSWENKLYINWEYAWTSTYTYSGLSSMFNLFARSTNLDYFKWYISNVIIENKTRTSQEISDYYNNTKSNYGL